jgi:hypothetical protein
MRLGHLSNDQPECSVCPPGTNPLRHILTLIIINKIDNLYNKTKNNLRAAAQTGLVKHCAPHKSININNSLKSGQKFLLRDSELVGLYIATFFAHPLTPESTPLNRKS